MQGFIAAGKFNVPVLEITQAADVGIGSFYNHFDSKDSFSRRHSMRSSMCTVANGTRSASLMGIGCMSLEADHRAAGR